MPGIASRSSTERNGPCCSRKATIFCAVTGPMPGKVSSCSALAELSEIGPPAACRPRGCAGGRRCSCPRHEHLLPVGDGRSEVHRGAIGPTEPTCQRDRVRDAGAGANVDETGPPNRALDVHDEQRM